MVEFNADLGGDLQGRVSVKAPVTDKGALIALDSANQFVGDLFAEKQKSAKEKAKLMENKSLAGYQNELLKLADAVDQRKLTPEGARTKARALHGSFVSNNPALTERAATLHSKTLSTGGLGGIVQDGDKVHQAEQKLIGEAVDNGFVFEWQSDQERQVGLIEYRKYKANKQALSDESQRIGLQSSRIGLSKAEIELADKNDKRNATKALDAVADGVRVQVRNSIADVRNRLSVDGNQASALQQITDIENQWMFEVNKLARASGNENIKLITEPLKQMFDLARKEFDGTLKADVVKKRSDYLQNAITTDLLEDPEVQKLYAIGKILPNADLTSFIGEETLANQILKKNSFQIDKTPYNLWDANRTFRTGEDENLERQLYTKIQKDAIRQNSNVPAEDKQAHTEQLNNNLHNMLKSIDIYKDAVDNPKKFNEIVDFIASPEFTKWTKANPLDEETANKAADVLASRYEKEALPAIEQWWLNEDSILGIAVNSKISANNDVTSAFPSDFVSVQFSEGGIKFTTKENPTESAGSFNTEALTARANREIAPIVNRIIRSSAHLAGHSNYEQVYKERFAKVFDDVDNIDGEGDLDNFKADDKLKGSQSEDNLEPIPNSGSLGRLATEPKARNIITKLTERGLPEHVALGFAANIKDESNFDAGINEINPTVAGSRGGFGLYQLTGPRRVAFERYAEANGLRLDDEDAQLDFLVEELRTTEKKAAKSILNSKDASEAAVQIASKFLRPAKEHLNKRVAKYRG